MAFNEIEELKAWREELKADLNKLYAKVSEVGIRDSDLNHKVDGALYRLHMVENRLAMRTALESK